MDCESRRELALKELEKARKHFEKIFTILDREEEIFELETSMEQLVVILMT